MFGVIIPFLTNINVVSGITFKCYRDWDEAHMFQLQNNAVCSAVEFQCYNELCSYAVHIHTAKY